MLEENNKMNQNMDFFQDLRNGIVAGIESDTPHELYTVNHHDTIVWGVLFNKKLMPIPEPTLVSGFVINNTNLECPSPQPAWLVCDNGYKFWSDKERQVQWLKEELK